MWDSSVGVGGHYVRVSRVLEEHAMAVDHHQNVLPGSLKYSRVTKFLRGLQGMILREFIILKSLQSARVGGCMENQHVLPHTHRETLNQQQQIKRHLRQILTGWGSKRVLQV